MAVVSLHTGIMSSPKHAPLSDAAFRLWTHALCWSKEHLTDGFIPSAMLPTLHPRGRKVVDELLSVVVPGKGPLWHEADGGYIIHDYAEWQETKDRVQDRRRTWREKKSGQRAVSPRDTKGDSPVDSLMESPHGSGSGSGVGKKKPPAPKGEVDDPLFARFYAAFPKKVAPDAAYAAWLKRRPDEALLQQMLDALAWQIPLNEWGPRNPYTPRPSKWLNEGQWKNERPTLADPDAPRLIDWRA